MANQRPRPLSDDRPQAESPPQRVAGKGWLPAAALVAGALLALAWLDGGEEPLRPIAEDIPLPEQEQ
ncbi:MAG: hypothetical protein EAY70_12775 [Sphingomonadales bacterium]|nr:MAG: hypothetical protein EAY70_12775 [Sphingomonadales bacterium]